VLGVATAPGRNPDTQTPSVQQAVDPQLAIGIPFADAEHACRLAAMTVRGAQHRLDVRLLERVERGQVLEACLAARRRFQRRAHGRGQMFG
jgi:hypothetical protein